MESVIAVENAGGNNGGMSEESIERRLQAAVALSCRHRAEHPVPGLQDKAREGVQRIVEKLEAGRISVVLESGKSTEAQ